MTKSRARKPAPTELALLGLSEGDDLPSGGLTLSGSYFTASGTSDQYLGDIGAALGCELYEGSFNLRVGTDVEFIKPREADIRGEAWDLVPVVLEECAVAVAGRRRAKHDPCFIELFSPVKLRAALDVTTDRAPVRFRVLEGRLLRVARPGDP